MAVAGWSAHSPAAVAAGERYTSAIEDELERRLGVEFVDHSRGPDKRPVREVAGVDQRLVEGFSARRGAVKERYAELLATYRAEHGGEAPRKVQFELAQQATLATRTQKAELESLSR